MRDFRTLSGILFIVLMFVGTVSLADESLMRFDQNEIKKFSRAISSSDYLQIREEIKEKCGVSKYDRDMHKLTIDQRLKWSGEILNCLEDGRASITSIAPGMEAKYATNSVLEPLIEKVKDDNAAANSEADFMGMKWGIGFGFSSSQDAAIDDAQIVNGVVRVNSNKKEQPRVLFEFHKYIWCNNGRIDGTRGCGPFVAVAATQNNIFSGIGIGFMYGFKSKPSDPDGFSIGLGAILDADVKDLASGFEANKAAPVGETSVRYTTESRWSTLLFVSRTF